jgi:sporulation protein YlmC with PRC-barrel domain
MSNPVTLSLTANHKVQNTAGEDLGKIEDLVLDESSGHILYAVLSFGGFLGMGNRLAAIPWHRLHLQGDHRGFLLNIDNETLENAPSFDREHWPDMSLPEWRARVETYFAYNPAEESQMAEGAEFIDSSAASLSLVEDAVDEETLARRVEIELSAASTFDMNIIEVRTNGGNVTLNGQVASQAELILADNIVRAIDGVRTLNNNLKVSKAA